MTRNKKEEPSLSPTSRAINALLNGEYPGMNVREVLAIISPENPNNNNQSNEEPKSRKTIIIDPDLRYLYTKEELDAFNK